MILITGGARSGKSSAARALAGRDAPVTYLATGLPSDEEMRERIETHRRDRPSGWRLIEEPRDLSLAIEMVDQGDTLIVDCLTLWVSNLMEHLDDEPILERSQRGARLASARPGNTIVVTNEVGSGIVPMDPLGRRFRDLHGRVNQMWAARAEQAFLVVAGRLLALEEVESIGG